MRARIASVLLFGLTGCASIVGIEDKQGGLGEAGGAGGAAGSSTAGSGTAGSGKAGSTSGTAGTGTAGSTAGTGTAGSTAGTGTAGTGTAGSSGGVAGDAGQSGGGAAGQAGATAGQAGNGAGQAGNGAGQAGAGAGTAGAAAGQAGTAGSGNAGQGGTAGQGGAGQAGAGQAGMGGSTCVSGLPPETPITGTGLKLVQNAAFPEPKGYLTFATKTPNAYISSSFVRTTRFGVAAQTGLLTEIEHQDFSYNAEGNFFSPAEAFLHIPGANADQFHNVPIGAGGELPTSYMAGPLPPSYALVRDWLRVGDVTYMAQTASSRINRLVGSTWDPNDVAPAATKTSVHFLARDDKHLYWTGEASGVFGRIPLQCNGDVAPAGAQATTIARAWRMAICPSTQTLYLTSLSPSPALRIYDLSQCADLASCTPVKTLTSADIPGMAEPTGVTLSPGCGTLQVGAMSKTDGTAPPTLLHFTLADPHSPVLAQSFVGGMTYDGLTIDPLPGAPIIFPTWHDGHLYVPVQYGNTIHVFDPTP